MKSFISKKKDKPQDTIKLSKNEIIIQNVNMAELDKRFAMAEMNNSLLKKNKNVQQTNILNSTDSYIKENNSLNSTPCMDKQSIVFTDDDIEIDIEIDTMEEVSNINLNTKELNQSNIDKKEVMLENVKNKIKNLMQTTKTNKEIIEKPNFIDMIHPVSKEPKVETNSILKNRLCKITVSENPREKLLSTNLIHNISETRNEVKDPIKQINKIKKEFDIKNVVSKLETIGISEHKSYNYNTLIKNESIICNSYNSVCNFDGISLSGINSVSCWWCRHPIPENLLPIGCPIKYHKPLNRCCDAKNESDNTSQIREYFDTEGFFCSFNCIVAYNNDVCQTNIRYRETGGLIYLLYKKIFGQYPYQMNIKPALSWKVLKSYGGEMSIHEYRNTFQKVENVSENVIKNKSLLLSSSTVFIEEKSNIKLSQSEF
jgi:hypothetical protein